MPLIEFKPNDPPEKRARDLNYLFDHLEAPNLLLGGVGYENLNNNRISGEVTVNVGPSTWHSQTVYHTASIYRFPNAPFLAPTSYSTSNGTYYTQLLDMGGLGVGIRVDGYTLDSFDIYAYNYTTTAKNITYRWFRDGIFETT